MLVLRVLLSGCVHPCIPLHTIPIWKGQVHWISSDRDDQRIILGLKLSIPGICLGRKIWQVLFFGGLNKVGIFWGHSKQSEDLC